MRDLYTSAALPVIGISERAKEAHTYAREASEIRPAMSSRPSYNHERRRRRRPHSYRPAKSDPYSTFTNTRACAKPHYILIVDESRISRKIYTHILYTARLSGSIDTRLSDRANTFIVGFCRAQFFFRGGCAKNTVYTQTHYICC